MLISLVPGNTMFFWAFPFPPWVGVFFPTLCFVSVLQNAGITCKLWQKLHSSEEAINQELLTRIWSGVGAGGGLKVTLLGSLTTCCERLWLMLWKFLLILSLCQDRVDLLSPSRFLMLVENQHSKVQKFQVHSNNNWALTVYWALCNRVKRK